MALFHFVGMHVVTRSCRVNTEPAGYNTDGVIFYFFLKSGKGGRPERTGALVSSSVVASLHAPHPWRPPRRSCARPAIPGGAGATHARDKRRPTRRARTGGGGVGVAATGPRGRPGRRHRGQPRRRAAPSASRPEAGWVAGWDPRARRWRHRRPGEGHRTGGRISAFDRIGAF